MRSLKIVLTAVGCPGAATMIRMLRKNGERKIKIVGVDMRYDAIGRFMTDEFYQVPPASSEDYIPTMLEIVKKESPDLLFPQSSYEVLPLSRHKGKFAELGVPVLVSDPAPIERCVDKAQMYKTIENIVVPVPRILYPGNLAEFVDGAKELGYPDKDVCFKPYISKGARGFRILSDHIDAADILLHERPSNLYMTLDSFARTFEGVNEFPRLLLMEYVKGREFTVDALVNKGEILLGMVKTRDAINTGLAMSFQTVDRPDLEKYSARVLRKIPLDFFVNIQFKEDKLLEINPRVSTFVYQDNLIVPYLGIKWALGEMDRNKLEKLANQIDYTRKTIRYYDQAFWNE